jgi:hypothetical protein
MSPRDEREEYSKGFDRGNYGNVYESQDWETWSERNNFDERSPSYQAGMILGFYSSYELEEIDAYVRDYVETLREEWEK